ncbi:MAG TPA: mandelate racemase/muconate lactonizing enzyme family protein, partial [Chloroflexota bacterium]|nr:mandelate racemase/muconate lactonizing enzyme family protein [Chloroflexota bacterium]
MKIVDVRVHPVTVARRYATAAGRGTPGVQVSHYYFLEIETDTGLTGVGEVSDISPRAALDGQPLRAARYAERLRTYLAGRDPFDLERLEREIGTPAFPFRSQMAAAVDIACHDLIGKATGQPLYRLLGGRYHERLPVCWVAYIRSPEEMEPEIAQKVAEGFRAFKLKVGRDIDADIERVKLVRDLAGEDAHIKLDANGAWSVEEAIVNLKRLEPYRPAAIETPIPVGDVEAMRAVKQRVGVPYMEHAGSPEATLEYVRAGVVDVFKISAGGLGGLRRARKVTAIVEAAGAAAYVGSTVEMGLGTTALGHFAVSSAACGWPCDLRGPLLLVDDVLTQPVSFAHGMLTIPDAPGLGVSLDPAKLSAL